MFFRIFLLIFWMNKKYIDLMILYHLITMVFKWLYGHEGGKETEKRKIIRTNMRSHVTRPGKIERKYNSKGMT